MEILSEDWRAEVEINAQPNDEIHGLNCHTILIAHWQFPPNNRSEVKIGVNYVFNSKAQRDNGHYHRRNYRNGHAKNVQKSKKTERNQ